MNASIRGINGTYPNAGLIYANNSRYEKKPNLWMNKNDNGNYCICAA